MEPAPPASSGQKHEGAAPSGDEIHLFLERLLASPAFRSSKRCQRFVQFTTAQLLNGRASTLKERTLATEVFDRSVSWDAGDDTIVRVGAREVRKRLAQYYASAEGVNERIRMELPLGSYVPEFVRLETQAPVVIPAVPAYEVPVSLPLHPARPLPSTPAATTPTRGRRRALNVVLALLACVAAGLGWWGWQSYQSAHTPPFAVFWAPFYHANEPVMVAIAHPLVYSPSSHAYQLNAQRVGPPDGRPQTPLQVPANALNGADFVPQPDQYLAFGDAVAASNLQMILAKHGSESHLRFASKVEFADFRDTPVIMIGAFSNRWTMEVTQRFRYHFGYDGHWIPAILDRQDARAAWSISQKKDDGTSPEDYFLICRLPNGPSGSPMVIGAGVAQFGTEAAGRFLTSPQHLDTALRGARKDWADHNLELLLHARVIGNSPAAPELVRSYVW